MSVGWLFTGRQCGKKSRIISKSRHFGATGACSSLWLSRTRRTPQRPPRIDSVRIELQHLVVELLSGSGRFRETVKIEDVLSRLFDDSGIVVAVRSLM